MASGAFSSDLYARLNLTSDATDAAIKKAYRSLALKHHPDKGGDPETFRQYAEAYAVLSDAEKRKVYDATGQAALADLDLDGMMAEVFEDGGWFEQMVTSDPLMREMADEDGMAGMQKSFGSFFASAMGGGGPVYMPDGTQMDAPRIKMPSLAELMADSTDPADRELMERVAKKMGIGERGALVAGTGFAALEMLQKMGNDPDFWSDGSGDDEDDDAFLDDLKNELQQKKGGGGPSASASAAACTSAAVAATCTPRGGGSSRKQVDLVQRGSSVRVAAPRTSRLDDGPTALHGATGDAEPPAVACTAPAAAGKAWLDAARNGHARELASLLSDEPTLLHFRGVGLGQTALHWACTKGFDTIVGWLIDKGAPIEAKNANGARAVHAAAAAGEERCVQVLIRAGASLHARDAEGKTAEQIALGRGHSKVAADIRLAERQAGADGGDGNGSCNGSAHSMDGASAGGSRRPRARVASDLTDVGDSQVAAAEDEPLRVAATNGDAAGLAAALGALPDAAARSTAACSIDAAGLTPLHLACRAGSAECVAALLSAGAEGTALSTKGNTPLAVAARHGQWAAIGALLDEGIPADALATLQAVRKSAPAELQHRLAVDAGGITVVDPPKAGGRAALMAAAAAGEAGTVARLLELKADVDLRDANGASALHYCSDKGSVQCAQLLLEGGAALEATDAHGNTPLHAAGKRGHAQLWEALATAGGNIDALNARGRAPKLLDAADADAACALM